MFNIYLKFDESLGKEGIARDYSVLGEENFEEIIKRYKEGFEGCYAKRKDLGGVGNIDYLISPRKYEDRVGQQYYTNVAFGELGEVFYIPVNLMLYWDSRYPLDTFAMESHINQSFYEDILDKYFKALIALQQLATLQKKSSPLDFGLYTITNNITIQHKHLLYQMKRTIINSFEDISKTRSDLILQKEGLKQQLLSFLKINGIEIIESTNLEQLYPLLFKYMASQASAVIEKELLGVRVADETYHLFSKKGDVFFRKRNYKSLKVKPDLADLSFTSPKKHTDVSINFGVSIRDLDNSFIELQTFILENFDNVISVKITYSPFNDVASITSDVSVDCEVISIAKDGFVAIHKLDRSIMPPTISFQALFIRIFKRNPHLLMKSDFQKSITQIIEMDCIEKDSDKYIKTQAPETFTYDYTNTELFLNSYSYVLKDSNHQYTKKKFLSISKGYEKQSIESIRGHITDFFWNNYEYREWSESIRDFVANIRNACISIDDKKYKLVFSSTDLSVAIYESLYYETEENPILKINRIGDFVDYSSSVVNITGEEVLAIYQEVINYAFFLQKNLVKKYGIIEYLLIFDMEGSKVTWLTFYLLTHEGQKIPISELSMYI